MLRACLAALAAILLVGCLLPDQQGPAARAAEGTADRLQLTGCRWVGGSTFPYPGAVAPGRAPAGWGRREPTAYVDLWGFQCGRVAAGPYERPATLLFDAHSNAQAPPACDAGRVQQQPTLLLNAVLVNDTRLADHLRATHGLPASHAESRVEAVAGAPARQAWVWGPPGQEPSRLVLLGQGGLSAEAGTVRFFWTHGDGVGVLDVSYTATVDSSTPPAGPPLTQSVAHGTMRPPMLLAGTASGTFTGVAFHGPSLDGEGLFRSYGDLACQKTGRGRA